MKSSQKVKVILQSLKLIDVPTRQNRVFLKAKFGSFHFTTKPYQIKDNTVIFLEPVTIDMTIPNDPKKLKSVKSARLSFRLENTSGSGFTRYGIVMLNIVQHLLLNDLDIRVGLENCTEKPVFMCKIKKPSNFNHPIQQDVIIDESELSSSSVSMSTSISGSFTQYRRPSIKGNHIRMNSVAAKNPPYFDEPSSDFTEPVLPINQAHYPQSCRTPRMHVSNSFNILSENQNNNHVQISHISGENSVLSNQSSSTVQKASLYEHAPVKILPERFKVLEDQIDNLLAGVIINN